MSAQTFNIAVSLPDISEGRAQLSIYDGSRNMPQYSARVQEGQCSFSGELMRNMPYYAELRHPDMKEPIVFFIEASNITIKADVAHPAQSFITGSKSNSEYRTALENEIDESVILYIKDHPTSSVSSTLAYLHLKNPSMQDLEAIMNTLSGDAIYSQHYKLLKEEYNIKLSSSEGHRIPDFEFPDRVGTPIHFDSVQQDSVYIILAFGATWCENCNTDNQRISKLIKPYNKDKEQIRLLIINIDKDKREWDNPMLKTLAIDYLPYIIITDREGRIVERGIRAWELQRSLPRFFSQQ